MLPLKQRLNALIKAQGPISVAEFMQIVLTDPNHGYYTMKDPLGEKGDFITSPEISQIFGELLGMWCAHYWHEIGEPGNAVLVELGPGRGTLMKDLLRATKHVPNFHDSLTVHMVESSPLLQQKQQQLLAEEKVKITWHTELASVPDTTTLLIANEFFDALPIHQFVKTSQGWRERLISSHKSDFIFTLAKEATPAAQIIPPRFNDAPANSFMEVSPASAAVMHQIADRIVRFGGAALVIDYGYTKKDLGDTLQAVKNHAYHGVLEDVGDADLTAHVDFPLLAGTATQAGAKVHPVINQFQLLQALGIQFRASALLKNATPEQQEDIIRAVERLMHPDEMGTLFKCLAVTAEDGPTPLGFHSQKPE